MKRFLALIAAVAMVAGALAIRAALDDDEGGGGGDDRSDDRLVLACIPELRAVCEEVADREDVELRLQAPEVTADLLDEPDTDIDAWATFDPWPAIADERADRSVAGSVTAVASSGMVIALWSDRNAVLEQACGGPPTWKCIGDTAGGDWAAAGGPAEWGPVKIGLPQQGSALGLIVLGWAAVSYFGNDDFGSNDFDATFRTWTDRLINTRDPDPVERLLQQGPGAFSLVATTDARFRLDMVPSRDGGNLTALAATPTAVARIVVAEGPDGRGERIAKSSAWKTLLASDGWETRSIAKATGLPDAGVLLALATG